MIPTRKLFVAFTNCFGISRNKHSFSCTTGSLIVYLPYGGPQPQCHVEFLVSSSTGLFCRQLGGLGHLLRAALSSRAHMPCVFPSVYCVAHPLFHCCPTTAAQQVINGYCTHPFSIQVAGFVPPSFEW